jgi:hypothetical protein
VIGGNESRLDRVERMLENLANNQIQEREARVTFREDLESFYQSVRQQAEMSDRAHYSLRAELESFAQFVR